MGAHVLRTPAVSGKNGVPRWSGDVMEIEVALPVDLAVRVTDAKQLVSSLLTVAPEERLDAPGLLATDWVRRGPTLTLTLNPTPTPTPSLNP